MKKALSFILSIIMCLGIINTVFAAEFKFTDVKEDAWYYADVKNAVEMGLVNGKGAADTYFPNDNLTYAEAIKLAACMNQLYMEGLVTLKNGNPWYQSYVDYCTQNGIIVKEYNYNDKATRAGYMEIFAKALPDSALKVVNSVADDSIPDVSMDKNYSTAVYKLYRAGILAGSDAEHNCKPLDNIKRSEVAAILSRMMDETKRVKFTLGEEVEPLKIKTQPTGGDVILGKSLPFSVEAEGGKTPYNYQWYIAGADVVFYILGDGTSASGSQTATLTYKFNQEGIKKLYCKVTDADGTIAESNKIEINVKQEEPTNTAAFKLTIEQSLVITNRGIVITGRVAEGELKKGDTIYIIESNGKLLTEAKVVNIEMFKKLIDNCKKGDFVGLQLDLDVDTWRDKINSNMIASGTKPLTIMSHTKSGKYTYNSITTLKVEVEGGSLPYSYQWYIVKLEDKKNTFGTKLSDVDGKIKGVNKDTLMVVHPAAGTYIYFCEISDANGNTVKTSRIAITCDEAATGGRGSIPNSGKGDFLE